MRCCRAPARRTGARGSERSRDGHVLRRTEALQRGSRSRCAGEVHAIRIRSEALLIRGQVAEIGLHRREVRLFLRVRELRNRDRGENADNYDDDQKFDQRESLLVPCHFRSWEGWFFSATAI